VLPKTTGLLLAGCLLASSACSGSKPPSEAGVIAKKYWDGIVVKCGSTSFSLLPTKRLVRRAVMFQAYTDFSYTAEPDALTEADGLNGVQWKGRTQLRCTSYQYWDPDGKNWSAWGSCVSPLAFSGLRAYNVELQKFKGKWFYAEGGTPWQEMEKYNPAPVQCGQIPQQ
jgi:hypothetical protein